MRWYVLPLLLVAGLSGCLEDDDASVNEAAAPEAPVEPVLVWKMENYTGEVLTTLPVAVDNFLNGADVVAVAAGTLLLDVNFTAALDTPTELRVRLIQEECESQECDLWFDTVGGHVQFTVEEPAAGNWNVVLFSDSVAVGTYEMTVGHLLGEAVQDVDAGADAGA